MWQYGVLPYRLLQMSHQNQYFLLSHKEFQSINYF